jgi:molybdopterin synthase sulfur carrier subunit
MAVVPRVVFTANLQRHVACPPVEVAGTTVRQVLEAVFALNPAVRSYLMDDQGGVRKHMSIFVDGGQLRDRQRQSDPVAPNGEIFVMQALSGG